MKEAALQMNDTAPIDCRAEATRCLSLSRATHDPYIRKALTKIADSYGNLADWIEREIAAGRRSPTDL